MRRFSASSLWPCASGSVSRRALLRSWRTGWRGGSFEKPTF
jgi:hypothetical protein